jgi:uncharacterized protein YkwD
VNSDFGSEMPSLVRGRGEQADDRARQRDDAGPQNRIRLPCVAFLRSAMLCAALSAGALFIAVPIGNSADVEGRVFSAAGGRSGLQLAVRLDPPPRGSFLPADVQAILDSVNAHRAANGISAVSYHEQLTQAGVAHAADQFFRNCQLSHTGSDGSSAGDRITRTGLRVSNWGENIACGQRTPAQVMAAWMNSSGHRKNILNSGFTHIGISISRDSGGRNYWVQVFGTPR